MKKTVFAVSILTSLWTSGAHAYLYDAAPQPYCREYTKQVYVGGRLAQSYGTACLQPDGSWQTQEPMPTSNGETRYMVQSNPVIVQEVPRYYPAPQPVLSFSFSSFDDDSGGYPSWRYHHHFRHERDHDDDDGDEHERHDHGRHHGWR